MSPRLPIKSSSRAGRFKKKLVPEESLTREAPVIEARMAPFLELYQRGKVSQAEFCAVYILTVLSQRFPGTWLGARQTTFQAPHQMHFPLSHLLVHWEPNIQKRLSAYKTLGDVFSHFAFKSTPTSVNRAVLLWSSGHYGLELMFRIPKPAEVLDQQKHGRRCVTILLDKEKASQFILGERDALGFTMHDLIHADHFYHDNACFQGQLGFYGFLDKCLREDHFAELLMDEKFEAEFEYLISDMNAYAIHLLKCFKSALLHYSKDGELFFHRWLDRLSLKDTEREVWMKLNTKNYGPSQDEVLLSYLNNFLHGS